MAGYRRKSRTPAPCYADDDSTIEINGTSSDAEEAPDDIGIDGGSEPRPSLSDSSEAKPPRKSATTRKPIPPRSGTPRSKPPAKPKLSPGKKKVGSPTPTKASEVEDDSAVDIVIPSALLEAGCAGTGTAATAECTVLVQIDPEDANVALDFHGASGAVGRFEADDDEGVKMDLKGFQYSGTIHPGPTALIASINMAGQLKIEAITDEFVTLRKTRDVMAQLDAVVEGDMDTGYQVTDNNVNVAERGNSKDGDAEGENGKAGKAGGTKKRRGEKKGVGGPATKRRKSTLKKKK